MKIALFSDTHLTHQRYRLETPPADMAIHAGDATFQGTPDEIASFAAWFRSLPYRHKIVIAGNHDRLFEKDRASALRLMDGITYLEDNLVEVDGLKIYGSPWTPEFMGWGFNLPRGPKLRAKWSRIPNGVDILVTHGPPHGILDRTMEGDKAGCEDLRWVVMNRVKPKLHVFGHIHFSYGTTWRKDTLFVNAAIAGEDYKPGHRVIVVDVEPSRLAALQLSGPGDAKLVPTGPPMLKNDGNPFLFGEWNP